MKDLKELSKKFEELRKKYEELGEEIKRLENLKKKKRWRAELNKSYFYIDNDGSIYFTEEKNYKIDNYRYKIRNYFETKEEAEKYLEKIEIYYELMDIAEELNGEEEIDWENGEQEKFSIRYVKGKFRNDFYLNATGLNRNIGSIYCLRADFLKVALERIGADKLKKLFKEE